MSKIPFFDPINEKIISEIIEYQGPPDVDETQVDYARRLIKSMNEYADGKRTVIESIIKKKVLEIRLKFDRPSFILEKIEQAKNNRLDFEALKIFSAKLLRQGDVIKLLSPELSAFLAGVLDGSIKPPPKAKRGGGVLFERRDFILAVAVFCVCEHFQEIKPSRNDATAPGESGADIVAMAALSTYDTTLDAYNKRKRFLNFIKSTKIESHYERTGLIEKTWPVSEQLKT